MVFGYVEKRLDKKAKDYKIFDVSGQQIITIYILPNILLLLLLCFSGINGGYLFENPNIFYFVKVMYVLNFTIIKD